MTELKKLEALIKQIEAIQTIVDNKILTIKVIKRNIIIH